jgi:hypothetical protein
MKLKINNNMKKYLLLLIAAATLTVSSAYANPTNTPSATITLSQGAYSYADGGEFTATTSLNGTFETFCTETTVEFTPGQTYSYSLGTTSYSGMALTEGTAFLFYEFTMGNLSGYNYTDAKIRQSDAGLLQAAIWAFQGQSIANGEEYPSATATQGQYGYNPYFALAVNDLGGNAYNPNDGKYSVDILQLSSGNTPAQDQLICTTPEPTTMALIGMGGLSLFMIRRRK